jgi:secondary thiamine-phosphate synthase enzyme
VAYNKTIEVSTQGEVDIIDITETVSEVVSGSGITSGLVTVFVSGSTAALTTIEFEPGLKKDIPDALERIASKDAFYHHEATWHDDNGHSHVRASLIGPSLTIPVVNGKLPLGQWQQIVLLELDTRPRQRSIVIQVV